MHHMFGKCSSLITLDLSSFDTSWVEDMGYMFAECESLKTLDISSFDLSQIHKYGSDSFLDKTGLSDLQQVSVKQPENLWPSVVRELAELGESCYQLEQAKMDIRACKRHGIPLFESELQ